MVHKLVIQVSELSKEEMGMVTSVHITPATSTTEWLLRKDSAFRATIAQILNFTDFPAKANAAVNISADDVIYVTPSPQLISSNIVVYFLVRDSNGAFQDFHSSQEAQAQALILTMTKGPGRPKRQQDPPPETGQPIISYFPSDLVVVALKANVQLLESALGQNVTLVSAGWVTPLGEMEPSAATSLFERRLDVFVPLILVGAICFLAMTIAFICVQTKSRSATWDPPAGVIYRKKAAKGVADGSVCSSKLESGCHLASDDQCRDGEAMKHAITDDDDWVVPYDRAASKNHMKTQFEDTKL